MIPCQSLPGGGTMSFSLLRVKKHFKNYLKKGNSSRTSRATRYKRDWSGLSEFCEYTNMHGFKCLLQEYETAKEQPGVISKVGFLIWIFAIFCAVFFTIYLVMLVLARFRVQPTLMTIETNYLETWKVDFPGVTICNVNAIYKPHTLKLTEELMKRNISEKRIHNFFANLTNLINFENGTYSNYFEDITDVLCNEFNYTTGNFFRDMAQPCGSFLKMCIWMGVRVECDKMFRLAPSSLGYCCSFNNKILNSSTDINSENYYQINAPLIRISGAGEDVSLQVFVDVEPHNYMSAKRHFYGTEIIIHDPEDFPEKSLLTAFSQPGTDVSIAVLPSVVATQEDVESLPVNLRFCRFEYERPLQITKKYSFQSCITECRAFTIYKTCGCIPFFYPPLVVEKNQKTPPRQCNLKDVKCLADNRHIFSSLEPAEETFNIYNGTVNGMNCDCVPSCTEQTFGVETFMSQRIDGVKSSALFEGVANLSSIVVYFKDLSCIKYRREMFMTWDGLLASFGGIFGLCLGGSVLSLVEIVYYATFRLYTKLKKNKKEAEKEAVPIVNILYNGKFLRLPNRPTGKHQLRQVYEKNDSRQFMW